jgi:hypothetical protein
MNLIVEILLLVLLISLLKISTSWTVFIWIVYIISKFFRLVLEIVIKIIKDELD